ncbi:MAG: type II toxin-antitoxin system VapC family toxin [Ignavibacteriales bacterium]|nr:MAG: type II toxin-antitoxin system VapC family toxin [Ignavibacteriales bacterium]
MPSETGTKNLITLDSSVIISYLIDEEIHRSRTNQIWNKLFSENTSVIIPNTVLVEVVSAIKRRTGSIKISENIKQLLLNTSQIKLIELGNDLSSKAADVSIKYGLRGMDSIIVATAIEFNSELITFDNEIIQKYLKRI